MNKAIIALAIVIAISTGGCSIPVTTETDGRSVDDDIVDLFVDCMWDKGWVDERYAPSWHEVPQTKREYRHRLQYNLAMFPGNFGWLQSSYNAVCVDD